MIGGGIVYIDLIHLMIKAGMESDTVTTPMFGVLYFIVNGVKLKGNFREMFTCIKGFEFKQSILLR
jgi:hypothetical protein